jgi:hypothetical protein
VRGFGGLFGLVRGFGAEGLEAVEVAGGLADGALDAVDHAADTVERAGDAFKGLAVGPELSFGVAETIETPGISSELVDELALDDVKWAPDGLEVCDESFEFSGIFARGWEGIGRGSRI